MLINWHRSVVYHAQIDTKIAQFKLNVYAKTNLICYTHITYALQFISNHVVSCLCFRFRSHTYSSWTYSIINTYTLFTYTTDIDSETTDDTTTATNSNANTKNIYKFLQIPIRIKLMHTHTMSQHAYSLKFFKLFAYTHTSEFPVENKHMI